MAMPPEPPADPSATPARRPGFAPDAGSAIPRVFDRALIARRRRTAIATAPAGTDFLVDRVAEEIADRLAPVARRFDTAVAIGGPTAAIARAVRDSGKAGRVFRADVFAAGPDEDLPADLVIDDEVPPFGPASVDLVVAGLTLQWVNDLPGTLIQIRRMLKPDGLFLATFVGGDSLSELRQAFLAAEAETTGGVSPRVAPFVEVRDLGGLLQRAGFALPVADQDRLTLRYATPFDLMRDLARMGAANPLAERRRSLTGPGLLRRAAEHYQAANGDADGRVRATMTLVSLSGWAPHESQQKPLKPGSAKMRLAEALKTTENPL
ncbi:methyltransferase domain-containing protein [Mongoliimonas terrestris]|uniref:methyltransferase domain-containing protein n=1 Tax=Mongoliimonas terrestris TaxID=1709001 RepID=UPI000B0B83F4|nr:methyltransferase domain-containing protein [Mongoliimonas terrestris]